MIAGVGTDILLIQRIRRSSCDLDDIFMRKTYSKNECEQAVKRDDPALYFATRFAGKEAVFKSLRLDGERIDFCNIEILNDDFGKPFVTLSGTLKDLADKKGVLEVMISLSYDTDYVAAFAIAQCE